MRSKGFLLVVLVIVLVAFGGCAGCSSYNGLVTADESVVQSWANVETQYQRRSDLIPNLVSTVQGAADFESGTLEAVTSARAQATSITLQAGDLSDPDKLRAFTEAQSQLGSALGRLLAVSENYPDLRATEAFRDLQAQLEGTENRINQARRDYNAAVASYNTSVRRFPTSIIAGLTGFERRASFEADAGAEQVPTVEFN